MIEHLFDESLLIALRDGRTSMTLDDVYEAKLTDEIGIKQPVVYTDADRAAVATHEAGHATVAYFLGKDRRLEVLSIIKRRDSLGLLAHGDEEERFTRSRTEIEAGIAIALGGLVAEEMCLGESGTGPANDLSTATDLAAKMVGAFGMSGSLISYDAISGGMLESKEPGRQGALRRRGQAARGGHPDGAEGTRARRARGEPRRPRRAARRADRARRARPRRDPPRHREGARERPQAPKPGVSRGCSGCDPLSMRPNLFHRCVRPCTLGAVDQNLFLWSVVLIGLAGIATGVVGVVLPAGQRIEVLLALVAGAGSGLVVLAALLRHG